MDKKQVAATLWEIEKLARNCANLIDVTDDVDEPYILTVLEMIVDKCSRHLPLSS